MMKRLKMREYFFGWIKVLNQFIQNHGCRGFNKFFNVFYRKHVKFFQFKINMSVFINGHDQRIFVIK